MKTAYNLWRDLHRQARLLPLAVLILTALPLAAQVPSLINYQGRLTDSSGSPVSGERMMEVRVYDAPEGGNLTYSDYIGSVMVTDGIYSFRFGSNGAGIAAALTGQDYLALSMNGIEETTRTRLLAVPYAIKSADAQATIAVLASTGLITPNFSPEMISVMGGSMPGNSAFAGQAVDSFLIGKYEVTFGEWLEVKNWAILNGYDLDIAGSGTSSQNPVTSVSWYDVVKWCNAKSEKEGLTPAYNLEGSVYRTGASIPTLDATANGYRLPREVEWEWAAHGGSSSAGYIYSGSNDATAVAWYSGTAGVGTKAVGTKLANELGIFDMSGNVWEWCEDITENSHFIRGGSFSDNIGLDVFVDTRYWPPSDTAYNNIGFRLARNSQANQSSYYNGSGTLSGTLNVSSSSGLMHSGSGVLTLSSGSLVYNNGTIVLGNGTSGLSKVGAGTLLLGNQSSSYSGSGTLSNGVLNVSSSSSYWINTIFEFWNGLIAVGNDTILLGDAGSLGGTSGQSLPTQDGTQSHATPPRPTPVMDPN
jgi:autotransporter-associated beta strand protein